MGLKQSESLDMVASSVSSSALVRFVVAMYVSRAIQNLRVGDLDSDRLGIPSLLCGWRSHRQGLRNILYLHNPRLLLGIPAGLDCNTSVHTDNSGVWRSLMSVKMLRCAESVDVNA